MSLTARAFRVFRLCANISGTLSLTPVLLLLLAAPAFGQETTNSSLNELLRLGQIARDSTNLNQAKEAFQKAVSLDPNSQEAQLGLANCLYDEKDFEHALDHCKNAVTLNAADFDAQYLLACCYFRLKDYEHSIPAYQASLSLAPMNFKSRFWLGRSFYRAHRYNEAISAFQSALEIKPNDLDSHYFLGLSFYQTNHYPEAARELQTALHIDPGDFDSHFWLAQTWWRLGRNEDAVGEFRAAARIKPDDFDSHYLPASILMNLQKFPEAEAEFEQAWKIQPDDQDAKLGLFATRLVTAQYRKAASLYPIAFELAGGALVLSYLAGLLVLLRKSLKKGVAPAPGLIFTLAWFLLFFEGQVAGVFLAGCFFPSYKMAFTLNAALLGCAIPVVFAALTGFIRQPWGGPFARSCRFPPFKTICFCLLAAITVALGSGGLEQTVQWVTGKPPDPQFIVPFMKEALADAPWLTALSVVMLAPMSEEILFRGILYGALENRLQAKWVIVITGAVFAFVHLQALYFLPLFGMGIVLGWVRHKTGSLTASFLIHSLNNGFALLALKFLH
jgi:tetratricopeptide (TPR) repeat protein